MDLDRVHPGFPRMLSQPSGPRVNPIPPNEHAKRRAHPDLTPEPDLNTTPGKSVARRFYALVDNGIPLEPRLEARVAQAESCARLHRREDYNIARFKQDSGTVALLPFPDFFEDPFRILGGELAGGPGGGDHKPVNLCRFPQPAHSARQGAIASDQPSASGGVRGLDRGMRGHRAV